MAYPIHSEQTETPGAPAPRHLIAAAVLTAVTLTAVGIDLALSDVELPPTVVGLVRAACVACWVVWYVAVRFNRVDRSLSRERSEAADWADGYVHGVARRTPPAERVRYFGD